MRQSIGPPLRTPVALSEVHSCAIHVQTDPKPQKDDATKEYHYDASFTAVSQAGAGFIRGTWEILQDPLCAEAVPRVP
ncbi:hypothetical protein M514_02001 [Trichuris suis]|uniref:Uncharacterized protein n=1 Tax=Trichuris suis TaxID=68888 RepID=A0A085NJI9_9BILA|nr:hypothetical protein M513_02001 [Trichuris suis]KFD69635.1 hypothetical protein M514_02001 [Trichuris suis]